MKQQIDRVDPAASKMITIAVGKSRKTKKWAHKDYSWGQLVKEFANTTRTKETYAEYIKLPKSQQDEIKDVGGFVGGTLKGGRRKKTAVAWRHLITLDADHAKPDFWEMFTLLFDYACILYSTHKHRPEKPRYRLVILLERPISAEQYEPISRMIAANIGIDLFDITTYEPHRLMYWPSSSKDAEFVFEHQIGPTLDPDEILAQYEREGKNRQDPFHWPRAAKETQDRQRQIEKVGDPEAKPGIIGAFNRVYPITDAIETFLPDRYEKAEENRYTYKEGSTYGGLVIYDNDRFAYSHHESDPVGGSLVNAFDLVRLHKFGELDEEKDPETPVNRLPSYLEMVKFAGSDRKVSVELTRTKLEEAGEDFTPGEIAWSAELKKDGKGRLLQTIENAVIILKNDKHLKGKIGMNEFSGMPSLVGDVPWRNRTNDDFKNIWTDADQAYLYEHLEKYGMTNQGRIVNALSIVFEENKFHPIREYLDGLFWDGSKRLETLFIDYLGAEDNPYIRAVTKKALVACVARVMRPGCKVDNLIVLIGRQGVGKSTILAKLGKQWFSDTLDAMKGKDAYGQLRGSWIIELGELTATRKADIETIKHFITKARDDYRKPYDRFESSVPRQCVFFGSTNDYDFLNDPTGNRRFWPVETEQQPTKKSVWEDLNEYEIDQIWAEATELYKSGYLIYLENDLVPAAVEAQERYTQENPLAGTIREYLERPVPLNWYELSLLERRQYNGQEFDIEGNEIPMMMLDKVCAPMIWGEALGKDLSNMTRYDAREINTILQMTPGWKRISSIRFEQYGRQKGFRRGSTLST